MFRSRIDRIAQLLPSEADAAILTSEIARKYFTGISSTAGIIFLTKEYCALIIDSRYIEAARQAANGYDVILQETLSTQLPEIIRKHGVKTVCMEEDYVTLKQLETYRDMLGEIQILANSGLSDTIDSMRRIKSPHELEYIKQAQVFADKGFTEILNYIKPGRTERQIAVELEYITRKLGSEGSSFEFIVVSGTNTSRPHGHPSDKEIRSGELITMDFGCIYNGFHSDMTRTVAAGEVGEKEKEVYDTVLKAQLAALEGIAPGKSGVEIDKIARDVIDNAGFGAYFTHGLGHSLGLEIHEKPSFSPMSKENIEAGNVMSVEPGIYIEGKFGVRIEDIIFIGQDGIQNLCSSPKNLIRL